jgi:two-component system NtrC family sensor kinase
MLMKKTSLIIFLLFPFVVSFANPDPAAIIDNIPQSGISLDKGWKFHAGDNKSWAVPAYDDAMWQSIDPSKPISYLPQVREAQIGWFRLRLLIGTSLRGKTVAFAVNQIGASEIYLNGKLIRQYGIVNGSFKYERLYDPRGEPLTIQLGNEPEQVLAIRYSYNKQNVYIGYGQDAFDIQLSRPANAWANFTDYFDNYVYRSIVFGVFLILSILHLFIYLSYRERKINLYLSFYTFFQACAFMNAFSGNLYSSNSTSIFSVIFFISAPLGQIFFLVTVYNLFNQPKKLWFKLLLLLCVLIIPLEFFRDYGTDNRFLDSFGILIYIEVIRVSIIAWRRKQPDALLFLLGQSIALFFFFLFSPISFFRDQPGVFISIEVDIAFLTPAVVISILLAREFAHSNFALKQQLAEVEKLSEKSLAQELEKQQLLASQNEMLERQVEKRTNELSQSLTNLKQTQSQLIQAEKMASLGELTAGIAHEIQNPLNFVNNFSEVNREMISELRDELKGGNVPAALAIADDIEQNEEKISHHGKRADSIVKGMLEHSRSHSGQKEPTDINLMADEFMRLSYHGLRAKDKSFNSEMITHFDPNLPKIGVIQQDIGRVFLNLFNNAFYAVNQKSKVAGVAYKPEVTVTTYALNGQVIIKVRDNGNGIPDAIKEKIMQPFFTTKPTGEGTGLGLSLTYDMVVKGHGGSISVDTKEGSYTEFTVSLPL